VLQLRPYQREACDAVFAYWNEEAGNPLVDLATGTGKSLVMATLIEELLAGWRDLRVLVVTHVAELIEQNYLELLGAWPFAPAGIMSAGLGRRDAHQQIVFCGIQTVWNKAAELGWVDVLFVDEAHLIPGKANTMYGKFIAALRAQNPELKIVGLTATPYRLDSGRLDEGDDRLFDRVVYTYGIADGIRDGYLAPLYTKRTETGFDLSGVGRQGGDYKQNALQAAVDKESVTAAAVAEIIEKGTALRSWLVFAAGVEHALHVRDEIRRHGISCETVAGDTPKEERRRILEEFKAYRVRCLTNNSVLTTGFNHPGVDLIAAMRPTLSASLYVQMMGRGTRALYAPGADLSSREARLSAIEAGPKAGCLVLDFAGLVRRHGPVDKVEPKKPGKGDGEAPVKACPDCDEWVHASARECPACGYEFPRSEEPKISKRADEAAILSTEAPLWRPVTQRTFRYHDKVGGTPSVRVDYTVNNLSVVKEWVCPQHQGFAKAKADRYWKLHGGALPFPTSVDEFLDRAAELRVTAEVQVRYTSKWPEIVGHRAGTEHPANDNLISAPPAANDNRPPAANDNEAERARLRALMDDDIPF
jgi:DNA repair protein RadD